MLQYNTWTIEQQEWNPAEELAIEQQLTFSNDYLCQTAHFEEYYSGAQRLCTYIKGIDTSILNLSAISKRNAEYMPKDDLSTATLKKSTRLC